MSVHLNLSEYSFIAKETNYLYVCGQLSNHLNPCTPKMDQIFNKWLSFARLCTDKSLDDYTYQKNCWAMQWYIILQDWLDFFDLLWKNLSIYVKWVKKPQLQIHFVMPASANCMSRHCCETSNLLFTYTFTYTGLYLYMYLYLMLMSFFPGFFKHLFWIFFTYTDIPKEYAHAALSVLCQHLCIWTLDLIQSN